MAQLEIDRKFQEIDRWKAQAELYLQKAQEEIQATAGDRQAEHPRSDRPA